MSVLSKLPIDEVRKRVPDRLARPRSTSTGLRAQVESRAIAGWDAAKDAARTVRGKTERRWPKRAGIVAAATGVAGGAAAFLKRIRSGGDEATPAASVQRPQPAADTPTGTSASNGSASKVSAAS